MGLLRKHKHVTRKTSRFANRPVVSLRAYRAAFRGPVNDSRYYRAAFRGPVNDSRYHRRHRLRLMPFFHKTHSILPEVSEGLADRRLWSPMTRKVFTGEVGHPVHSVGRPVVRHPLDVVKRREHKIVAPPHPIVRPSGKNAEFLKFNMPKAVKVCLQRKQRREVLLALGHGGGKHKPPQWNEESYMRC